jgi:DNA processing protein
MGALDWLALSEIRGIGGATARALVARFGGVEALREVPDEHLRQVPRVSDTMVQMLRTLSLPEAARRHAALLATGVQVITWEDDAYPANLRAVTDAPVVIFARGALCPADARAVAIVGTRTPSPAAVAAAETLAWELARRGLTIVSGLARGVDTAAHRGALWAAAGRTLAAPSSGLRVLQPRENLPLVEAITHRGALLSELHPDTRGRRFTPMARDRIISGLSRAVIVVEAGEKSGSLDTAAQARRQGCLLFAVRGSPGTDALLAQGAERLEVQQGDLDALCECIRTS